MSKNQSNKPTPEEIEELLKLATKDLSYLVDMNGYIRFVDPMLPMPDRAAEESDALVAREPGRKCRLEDFLEKPPSKENGE